MGVGYIEPVEDFAEKQYALQLIMEHMATGCLGRIRAEGDRAPLACFRIAVREFTGKERLP